jgi:hypothetical protein
VINERDPVLKAAGLHEIRPASSKKRRKEPLALPLKLLSDMCTIKLRFQVTSARCL